MLDDGYRLLVTGWFPKIEDSCFDQKQGTGNRQPQYPILNITLIINRHPFYKITH